MGRTTAEKLHISLRKIPNPPSLHAIDRHLIGSGQITHCIAPIILITSFSQRETLSFMITESPKQPIILGNLRQHDPLISWSTRELTQWSAYCHAHCIEYPKFTLGSTTKESPGSHAQVCISVEYQEFIDVFSKVNATGLPPHRSSCCAVDLLPATMPPRSRVYPLSLQEQKALQKYI